MRSNKRRFIPERDKKKIIEKIKVCGKRNTAAEATRVPAPVHGDKLSVLQNCAKVGVQKWPITRKWVADETLLNKGYDELEFHSRCNFNPVMPECEPRAYLIGPKQFVELDEEKYKTAVFDEDDTSEIGVSPHQAMSRRLTAHVAKFHEVPDGYKKRPVVLAQTWDVKFIPKKIKGSTENQPQNFINIQNVTLEALMEIYKHSEGFFVTSVNTPKYVMKRCRRISETMKKEIRKQSILKPQEDIVYEDVKEVEKTPSAMLLKDIMLSQLDWSVTSPPAMCEVQRPMYEPHLAAMSPEDEQEAVPERPWSAAEELDDTIGPLPVRPLSAHGLPPKPHPTSLVTPQATRTLSKQTTDQSETGSWDTSHADRRIKATVTLDEVIVDVQRLKHHRSSKQADSLTPRREESISEVTPDSQRTSERRLSKTKSVGIKPKDMKKFFSKDWQEKIAAATSKAPSPKAAPLPKGLKHLVVAEDVKNLSSEDKQARKFALEKDAKRLAMEKEKANLSHVPGHDAMKAVRVRLSSEKKSWNYERVSTQKETDRQLRFRRVRKSDAEEGVMMLPEFPMPERKPIPEEVTPIEKKKEDKPPLGRHFNKADKSADDQKKTAAPPPKPKPKEEKPPKKEEVLSIDLVPEMGKKDVEEYRRYTIIYEPGTDKEIESPLVSSAWSRKRAVKKLRTKKLTDKQKEEDLPMSQVHGQIKSLHSPTEDSECSTIASVASLGAVKKKMTGIPEFDIPEDEPLKMEAFDTDAVPTFEERSHRLTKAAKKRKQTKPKVVTSTATRGSSTSAEEDSRSLLDDIITSKMDSGDSTKKQTDRKSARKSEKIISKLELLKQAKQKGEVEKEKEIMHDLVDTDKPLKVRTDSPAEEKKSPFQMGGNLRYTESDEDRSKAKSLLSREISRIRTETDEESQEGMQRVGDLDLYEISSSKKKSKSGASPKKPADRSYSKMRFYGNEVKPLYKGKKKLSLRSKYGLYHTSYLAEDGQRNSIPQDGPDEAMYTFGRFPGGVWSQTHELGAQPRFHFPIELAVLDGISPMEYLERYTSIPSRRLGVYQRIFTKHAVRKEIPMSVMKHALDDMVVGSFPRSDFLAIMSLVERNKAKAISWDEFKLICCLTDRLMDESGQPSAMTPMTDYLQVADSNTMLNMLKEKVNNMPLTNLLNAVASCQLYY